MTFLIILLIILLFWFYGVPWLMRRYVRKTFGIDPRDPFGRQQRRPQPQPQPEHPKKKIDPTVGEYVEFTETTTSTTKTDSEGTTTETTTEQQITDVQWEELPPEQ